MPENRSERFLGFIPIVTQYETEDDRQDEIADAWSILESNAPFILSDIQMRAERIIVCVGDFDKTPPRSRRVRIFGLSVPDSGTWRDSLVLNYAESIRRLIVRSEEREPVLV